MSTRSFVIGAPLIGVLPSTTLLNCTQALLPRNGDDIVEGQVRNKSVQRGVPPSSKCATGSEAPTVWEAHIVCTGRISGHSLRRCRAVDVVLTRCLALAHARKECRRPGMHAPRSPSKSRTC